MVRLHVDGELAATWEERVQRWVEFGLAHHARAARRVSVRFYREASGDAAGAAAGHFTCEIDLRLRSGASLALRSQSVDAGTAVAQACARARRALVRACLEPSSARPPAPTRDRR
jgi:hypothetical protein